MAQLQQNKIAIVGGGPSGIYCALHILESFKNLGFDDFFIHIFDKSQVLRTILPTGGTRCNITNSISDIKEFAKNYPRGEKFLYSIFSKHFNIDSLEFFNNIGIKTYVQENGNVYPISNSSKEVKDKLLEKLKQYKNYKLIHKEIYSKDDLNEYDYIVISAGSRGTQNLITNFNHTLIPFKKALVGLKIKDNIYPQGVSLKTIDGDFVFTQNGISGPLPYKISSINVDKEFPYEITICLFDVEKLKEIIKLNPKKSLGNIVSMLIPKSLAKIIVKDFDKKASETSKKELEELSKLKLTIIGTDKTGEVVHSGGVKLDELTNNCKSRICENLWYCGEILNIDGFCGGFNLQNCWSTGYIVANDVVKVIMNKVAQNEV